MNLGISFARFSSIPNRFTVIAKHRTRNLRCYLPNPSRLEELLTLRARIALDKLIAVSKNQL